MLEVKKGRIAVNENVDENRKITVIIGHLVCRQTGNQVKDRPEVGVCVLLYRMGSRLVY